MAAAATLNPLISTQPSSGLQVILHPLVLLTVSDYIARHTLRQQEGPIVGVLLGQSNSREVTAEHAFDAHVIKKDDGTWTLDEEPVELRTKQMVTVHPDLEVVGWYTLLPSTGPTPAIYPIHRRFFEQYTAESAILLGFHPEEVDRSSAGGKLPLTIYESSYEVDDSTTDQDGEEKMDDGQSNLKLKFRELPYTVESDETEMISMNYVAGAGGSAAAAQVKEEKPARSVESNGKGKRRLVEADEDAAHAEEVTLTPEEDETVAALTARANAIKMLQSRIHLLSTYLQRLPPSYVAGDATPSENMETNHTTPSLTVLRQIQALVSRLDLVIPSDEAAFDHEMLCEANDVKLVGLLNDIIQGVRQAREVGKKFSMAESIKTLNRRGVNSVHDSGTQGAPYSGLFSLHGSGDLL